MRTVNANYECRQADMREKTKHTQTHLQIYSAKNFSAEYICVLVFVLCNLQLANKNLTINNFNVYNSLDLSNLIKFKSSYSTLMILYEIEIFVFPRPSVIKRTRQSFGFLLFERFLSLMNVSKKWK